MRSFGRIQANTRARSLPSSTPRSPANDRAAIRRGPMVVPVPAHRSARCEAVFARGGHHFLSRQAYRLGYASQREMAQYRAQRQVIKAYRALGAEETGEM